MKTSNEKLFNFYTDALENGDGGKNEAFKLSWFWNAYTEEENLFINDPSNYREALKIANAIVDGEEVELEERRYALRAKNVKDNDGDDIYLMSYSGRLGVYPVLSLHSEKEWDGYFARTPYMHREDFEEVEE